MKGIDLKDYHLHTIEGYRNPKRPELPYLRATIKFDSVFDINIAILKHQLSMCKRIELDGDSYLWDSYLLEEPTIWSDEPVIFIINMLPTEYRSLVEVKTHGL